MNTPKQLKDLPGFNEALAEALEYASPPVRWKLLRAGEASLPGDIAVSASRMMLEIVALAIGAAVQAKESRRLRLVPPPRLAANDCEASQ